MCYYFYSSNKWLADLSTDELYAPWVEQLDAFEGEHYTCQVYHPPLHPLQVRGVPSAGRPVSDSHCSAPFPPDRQKYGRYWTTRFHPDRQIRGPSSPVPGTAALQTGKYPHRGFHTGRLGETGTRTAGNPLSLAGGKGYLQADETTIKVLDSTKKKETHLGYYWAYHNPMDGTVLFDYQKGRNQEAPQKIPGGFKRYLQTDGYQGYHPYAALPGVTHLCWLNKSQAMYHFISGYTAKVAGTEMGISEPKLTFSACFGAAFLPLHPARYATILGEKMEKYDTNVWLINTGWTGGPYGVGSRMKLAYTRAMITAALQGKLEAVDYTTHPVLGMQIPQSCPDVPTILLNPEDTWQNPAAYYYQAEELGRAFIENFRQFESIASADILWGAPRISNLWPIR